MHSFTHSFTLPPAALAGAGLLLLAGTARPASAQAPAAPNTYTSTTYTGSQKSSAPLPIALPPGATLQTEADAGDADVLGLIKSFLGGLTGPGAAGVPASSALSPYLGLATDAQVTAVLQNVHRLHVVTFAPAKGGGDLLPFYEGPLTAAGGHRVFWQGGPQNPTQHVLVVGFDQPPSFAVVSQSPDQVVVVRADGYPDMAVIGRLVRAYGAASATSATPAVTSTPPSPAPRRTARRVLRAPARHKPTP